MVDGDANRQTQIEPLAVHVDQLVPENMERLAREGYHHTRDPHWLIFLRVVTPCAPTSE